jgi:hypothetical protein
MVQDDGSCDEKQGFTRREVIETTLLGLGGAAACLLPIGEAEAAPSDPAGPKVPKNPIPAAIQKGIGIELVDFCTPPRTKKTAPPFALLNTLYHMGDGSGRIFANDSRGKLYRVEQDRTTLILDLAKLRGSKLLKSTRTLGFRSFAFHPDFKASGKPGFGKLYTVSTETTSGVPSGVQIFKGDFPVHHHDVVTEWTLNPSTLKVNASSRRELFRIAQHSTDHNTDQLMFDPNLKPGDPGYGLLFITVGDGGKTEPGDKYRLAQNLGVLNGKVLRIDPLKQPSAAYRIPADNPFTGKAGARGEIWAYGFRHPEFLAFDVKALGGGGTMFIADIGQNNIEELNIGQKGGNYGWSRREGTYVTDAATGRVLYSLAKSDDPGLIYAAAQYDHSEGKAICGGYVYRGSAIPELETLNQRQIGRSCAGAGSSPAA